MNKQFWLVVIFSFLILCSLGAYLGYQNAQSKISKDNLDINNKIEALFNGKNVIQDGNAESISGNESKYGYFLFSGGFTIYMLSKESGGFVMSKINPGNITWLKGKTEYDKIAQWTMPTYRPEPSEAYQRAYHYLLNGTDKEPNLSYTIQSFTQIKDFPEGFNSDYHFIVQKTHPTESYSEKNENWYFTYDSYKLEYSKSKRFFQVELKESEAKTLIIKYCVSGFGIGFILTICLSFMFRIFFPNSGKSNSIFDKRWKNIENNTIISIEPKPFGKNLIVLIDNEKIIRGIAKFSDNGNSIHFSFPESEFFYKLIFVSETKLELENLANNSVSKFELLGSNSYSQVETVAD